MSWGLAFLMMTVMGSCQVLKHVEREQFRQVFSLPRRWVMLGFVIIVACVQIWPGIWESLPAVLTVTALAIYLKRLRMFFTLVGELRYRWQITLDALHVVLLWLIGVFAFSEALYALIDGITDFEGVIITSAFSSVLIVVLIARASEKFSDMGFWYNMGFRARNLTWLKKILVPVISGLAFAGLGAFIVLTRDFQPETPLQELLRVPPSPLMMSVFLVLAVLVAPLLEEIVFRGYFYEVLKTVTTPSIAFYAVALSFGLLHVGQYWGDLMAIAVVMMMGFVLTALRVWTNTTLASAVTHYSYNLGVVIIPVIFFMVTNPAYLQYQVLAKELSKEQSEGLLLESIKAAPDFGEAYLELARLYRWEFKDYHTALQYLKKARGLMPGHPHISEEIEDLKQLLQDGGPRPDR